MSENRPPLLDPLDNARLPGYLTATAIVILLLTTWLWWATVSVDPVRVFNGMLANSLSTTSVTLKLSQANDNSAKEFIQLQFGAQNLAHALTTLSQNGNTVTTETIGAPADDYTRYTSIKTSKKDKNGRPVNVGAIENVWAKISPAEAAQNQSTPLFEQVVLGVGLPLGTIPVPMGDLPSAQRAALLTEISGDNVYAPDFAKVKKGTVNGRLAYAYPVTLQPVTYARLMQHFAQALGLHQLDSLDPDTLNTQQPVEMTLIVDAHTQQLVEVDYSSGSYHESYAAYGAISPVTIPQKTISNAELQQRLSALES